MVSRVPNDEGIRGAVLPRGAREDGHRSYHARGHEGKGEGHLRSKSERDNYARKKGFRETESLYHSRTEAWRWDHPAEEIRKKRRKDIRPTLLPTDAKVITRSADLCRELQCSADCEQGDCRLGHCPRNAHLMSDYHSDLHRDLFARENETWQWDLNARYQQKSNTSVECLITTRMRAIVVDWLVAVCREFVYSDCTLHMCISLMDRYLAKTPQTERSHLQLAGSACLMIASKYHEMCPKELNSVLDMTDRAYSCEELLGMEVEVLNKLEFIMNVPTYIEFLDRLRWEGLLGGKFLYNFAHFILEVVMLDMNVLAKYPPSHLVSAAVYLANRMVQGSRHSKDGSTENQSSDSWSEALARYMGYAEESLRGPGGDLYTTLKHTITSEETFDGVKRKFRMKSHGHVCTAFQQSLSSKKQNRDEAA